MRIGGRVVEQFAQGFAGLLEIVKNCEGGTLYHSLDLAKQSIILGEKGSKLVIEERPANLGTSALCAIYVVENAGIPFELKSNRELNYSYLIAKYAGSIPGYEMYPISIRGDSMGNSRQEKRADGWDVDWVMGELETLKKARKVLGLEV